MLNLRHIAIIFLSATLLPAGLVSCQREALSPSSGADEGSTPVQMSVHFGSAGATKADLTTITEMRESPSFRGLWSVKAIPFSSTTTVGATDLVKSYPIALADISTLISTNNSHLYDGPALELPLGTSSALVYGFAPGVGTDIATKHKYGSLIPGGFVGTLKTAGELSFSPETMLEAGSGIPSEATAIAATLNAIVFGEPYTITAHYNDGTGDKTTPVSMPWDGNIGDANLKDCYDQITAGGALIPGSGAIVSSMLTSIYRSLKNYVIINPWQYEVEKDGLAFPATKDNGDPLTYADLYNGIKERVMARFANCTYISVTGAEYPVVAFKDANTAAYPEIYGLPSGAAVVRWTPSGYVVPLENGLDGIAPISRYCYPPQLYYYANTTIKTSNDASVNQAYTAENTWEQILERYKGGRTVSSSTVSVALVEPLQFAVGMLEATVKASAATLQDNDDKDYTVVTVGTNNFPLTGIIIGRQYVQNFDFTPQYTAPTENDPETEQYYLYDDQISGIYLATTESASFRTLALQTPAGKDAYFTMEFRNDSGQAFYGAEGRILPGHKFYLVGKLEITETSAYDKVFMQDRITKAHCVIPSLRNAHSAVPDMGIPTLSLGVETDVNWILSTPTTVMLE